MNVTRSFTYGVAQHIVNKFNDRRLTRHLFKVLGLLLLVRHVLLPRLSDRQLRRFDAPLVLLFGVFIVYLTANFLEALP